MEVYLDNSATTRAYECVRDIVGKVMCEDYGNPSSMHKKVWMQKRMSVRRRRHLQRF